MDVKLGEPRRNLAQARQLAAEAARRGSDLLVLPELWATGYDLENATRYAAGIDEGIFAETAVLAREYNLHIIGSNLSLLGEGQFGNTAVLHAPSGKALAAYSKIHLFGLMDEDKYLTGGDGRALIETVWGKTGLAICYDLRFPELFRAYALDGAKIIFLPSEWPYPRLTHWRTLLRARAIENQIFIAACNRVGATDGTTFFGHSCVIDPWGETVIEAGDVESLLTVTIDLDKVGEVQAKIPILSDRQPQTYL
ncbi:MAG: carbon-nitrogen family hydrolase [Chloroflexi bacterium]|nr:carbon-nitrogen family hydrolase [Chloroflexota bacterium]